MPNWNALHPAIVHFPIGLLVAPPLILLGALLLKTQARVLSSTALGLAVLGTIGLFVAVSTGEAAADYVQTIERHSEVDTVIHDHEELAETVQWLFAIWAVIHAQTLIGFGLKKWLSRPGVWLGTQVVLLVGYVALFGVLLRVSHLGGRIVHEFMVVAPLGG